MEGGGWRIEVSEERMGESAERERERERRQYGDKVESR